MASLLISFLLLSSPGDVRANAAPPESVLVTYDLSSLGSLDAGSGPSQRWTLLPSFSTAQAGKEPGSSAPSSQDAAGIVVGVWRTLMLNEFEFAGRQLMVAGDGRLRVLAPQALQDATAQWISFVEGAVCASTVLSIDVYESEGTRGESAAALVPLAELDLVLGSSRGERKSLSLPLRPGKTTELDLSRAMPRVVDYNLEIAQSSAIFDPIVEEVPVGMRLYARGAPSQNGMWLSLIAVRTRAASTADRPLGLQFLASTQQEQRFLDGPRSVQSVDLLCGSIALDTFLPEGHALVLTSAYEAGSVRRAETIVLRRTGPALAPFARWSAPASSPGGAREAVLLDGWSAAPPTCDLAGTWPRESSLPKVWQLHYQNEPYLRAGFAPSSTDELSRTLTGLVPNLKVDTVGPWLVLRSVGAEERADLFAAVTAATQLAPPARLVEVDLALRRGDVVLARSKLPVRLGARSAVVLGREGLAITDYDVEVAQSAASADPQPYVTFDGLAAWVQPSATAAGGLVLELAVRAHASAGETRDFDPETRTLGRIEEPTYDRLVAHERFAFEKGGEPWKVTVGGAPLALDVSVRPLR